MVRPRLRDPGLFADRRPAPVAAHHILPTQAPLFAAIPLMIGFGEGAELRRPLGVTIFGGLLLSQLLTIFTTPVIYLAFDRLVPRKRPTGASASEPDPRPAT